jgi:hypothetical protein
VISFVANFFHFAKHIFKKECFVCKFLFFEKKIHQKLEKFQEAIKNHHNCLQYKRAFIFLILSNLVKYIYELSSFKQHHKIEKNHIGGCFHGMVHTKWCHGLTIFIATHCLCAFLNIWRECCDRIMQLKVNNTLNSYYVVKLMHI